MPGPSARRSTCCSGSSRCAPARPACSSAAPRSAGRACSATSASAAAPCVGRVSAEEHRAIVEDFCSFIAGQTGVHVKRLERQMHEASDQLEFELAARLRDDIGALTKAMEKNAVVLADGTDADVIAVAEDPLEIAVQVFYVRGGRIRGERGWVADRVDDAELPELLRRFLIQVYDGESADAIPREVLLPRQPDDAGSGHALAERQARQQGRASGATARRQAQPDGDRGPQRGAGPGDPQDPAGERPHDTQPSPRGHPAGARPARGAAAHRVLRRLQPARAPRWSRRWSSSRTGCRARATTGGS